MDDDDNELMVLAWTASRLTAGPEPAYGSDCAEPPLSLPDPSVYTLPRCRMVEDWRKACAADDQDGMVTVRVRAPGRAGKLLG